MTRPLYIDVTAAGARYLPFAKNKLQQLRERLALCEVETGRKILKVDNVTIHLGTFPLFDRIRIEAGGLPVIAAVYVNGTSYKLVVYSTEEILHEISLPAGLKPFAVAISGAGSDQYVACTANYPGVSVSGDVEFTLVHTRSGSIVGQHTATLSQPGGFEFAAVRTRHGIGDASRQFSLRDGKCLLYAGGMVNDSVVYGGHRNFLASTGDPTYHYDARAVVLYFDGESLSVETTSWGASVPFTAMGGSSPAFLGYRDFTVTCAPDCSFWVAIIDIGERRGGASLRVEKHVLATDTAPATVSVYEVGPAFAFDVSFGRDYPQGLSLDGYASASGVARSTYSNWAAAFGPRTLYILEDGGTVISETGTTALFRQDESPSGEWFSYINASDVNVLVGPSGSQDLPAPTDDGSPAISDTGLPVVRFVGSDLTYTTEEGANFSLSFAAGLYDHYRVSGAKVLSLDGPIERWVGSTDADGNLTGFTRSVLVNPSLSLPGGWSLEVVYEDLESFREVGMYDTIYARGAAIPV